MTDFLDEWTGKVWVGDCLEFMRQLPDGCVDVIVTDPPYGTGNAGVSSEAGAFMVGEFANVLPLALPDLYRIMANDGGIYLFLANRLAADWILRLSMYFKPENLLVWDKGQHGVACSPYAWYYTHEAIFYGVKGRGRLLGDGRKDVLRFSRDSQREHPTQKPEAVIERILEVGTHPHDLIFDPFLGSGTTAVVAERLGRRWLGAEINPGYAKMAEERIKRAREQLRLIPEEAMHFPRGVIQGELPDCPGKATAPGRPTPRQEPNDDPGAN